MPLFVSNFALIFCCLNGRPGTHITLIWQRLICQGAYIREASYSVKAALSQKLSYTQWYQDLGDTLSKGTHRAPFTLSYVTNYVNAAGVCEVRVPDRAGITLSNPRCHSELQCGPVWSRYGMNIRMLGRREVVSRLWLDASRLKEW